jgi:hypothetical protein
MGLKWKLDSLCLEIVLILMQDRCTVWANCTKGSEIIWTHRMELLGDVGHVESHFGQFGDSISVGAREVHGLGRTYHKLRKSFWTHMMQLLGDVGHVDSCFGPIRDSVSVGAR